MNPGDIADGILAAGRYGPSPRIGTERANIANVLADIDHGKRYPMTPRGICALHRDITTGAELPHHLGGGEPVLPGKLRTRDVLGAVPARDLPRMLQDHLEEARTLEPPQQAHAAHWATALLIPFPDGNGRTARLLGIAVLTADGTDTATAAQVLAPHWALTRDPARRAQALIQNLNTEMLAGLRQM